jgi:excisionase family DNA binding protein
MDKQNRDQSSTEFRALIKKAISEANLGLDDILTQNEAAAYLRISKPTFIKLRRNCRIPFYQEGRKFLYRKSELLKTLKSKHK